MEDRLPATSAFGVPGRAAVAAGHPETVHAAVEMLEAGGNAYDAVVAAGFAAAVAEPGFTSLGGGGFLLARTAGGEATLFDFFVDTPGRGLDTTRLEPHFTPITIRFRGAEQVFNVGWGSVAVPGCLAGYVHVHRRLGQLGLDRVVAPAARLAGEGVIVSAMQAYVIELLAATFTLTDESRSVFAPHGSLLGRGDRIINPVLAVFLDRVGNGEVTGFGDPDVGRPLVRDMARHGGLATADDLASYRVVEREPLAFDYRGARILTNPSPAFGGELVGRGLRWLEEAGEPEDFGSGTQLRRLADVFDRARRQHLARTAAEATPTSTQGTTHVSVCDRDGNVASMTTSNGSCAGVFAPGTGVQLNNIMGEQDLHPGGFHSTPAGLRVGSMMAPSIVVLPDGRSVAVGSGGSERIRSAVTQLVVDLVDHGMTVDEAVRAPRLHWDGETAQVEPGFDGAAVDALRADRTVNVWGEQELYFGGAQLATTAGEAAGDPRRGGATAEL